MTPQDRSGRSIFARILGVMLACVVAVQLVNLGLLFIIGPPPPRVYSIGQVAAVFNSGSDASGQFRLSATAPPTTRNDGLSRVLASALARQLGVAPDRVMLKHGSKPFLFGGRPPDLNRGISGAPEVRDGILIGDFAASLRRPDGRWLTVTPKESRAGAWHRRALLWLLAALAAAAPFAWVLARRVSKPIGLFAEAAERIGRDPRAAPLPIEGPAEIAHAAAAFNEMQQRLNRYVDDRTLMTGAIAHDLRTPLMRLSLRLENVPEPVRQGCARDVSEMQAMIVAATNYVRDVTQLGQRRRLDLRSLVESVVDDHADRGESVTLLPGDGLVIEGNATALKTVLNNLVSNALRYAGEAELRVAREDGHAVIEVRDHGPGLTEDDLPRVFEPFFRGERSRNRDTGGIGLGLASVRGVARAHGGDVSLDNHPGGGAVARVTLPL